MKTTPSENCGDTLAQDTSERRRVARRLVPVVAVVIALVAIVAASNAEPSATTDAIEFTDAFAQTRLFHRYNRSIVLTREQDRVMREALLDLPAACCSDRPAYTCCCQCNMAKAWWGLAKHLIADRGLDGPQVREAVIEWLRFINPNGFSGDACYTAGCNRPFDRQRLWRNERGAPRLLTNSRIT